MAYFVGERSVGVAGVFVVARGVAATAEVAVEEDVVNAVMLLFALLYSRPISYSRDRFGVAAFSTSHASRMRSDSVSLASSEEQNASWCDNTQVSHQRAG